jgi:alkylated DNA repair dioxygenase AlkB
MSRDPRQAGLFDAPQELPQGLLYEPDFLTREEEDALLAAITPLPLREAKFREYFAKRRVAHFHNDGDTPYYDDGDADSFTSGPLPPFLLEVRDKVARRLSRSPEDFVHALVSEYRPGTPIGWHRDKPQYGIVVGISMCGVGRMRWRPYAHQDPQHTVALDLAPRSLYVMRDAIRSQWQHSMLPTRELRYSITLRTRATAHERAAYLNASRAARAQAAGS